MALDGTKLNANPAPDVNLIAGTIEDQTHRMLADAETTDAREDRQFGTGVAARRCPRT